MAHNKILSLLGLAEKAGRIASGEFATEKAIKEGKAKLVIVTDDASANTKKRFTNSCAFYKTPILIHFNKEELGHRIGKELRASVAVLDDGFADAIMKQMNHLSVREKVGD